MTRPVPVGKAAFVAARTDVAHEALAELTERYYPCPVEEAEVIVALGGDGFLLHTLHRFLRRYLPVFGMIFGTVGFLMNESRVDGLGERLRRAAAIKLKPLRLHAETANGETITALAINEVSLLRDSRQTAALRITVDGHKLRPASVRHACWNTSRQGPCLLRKILRRIER